MEATGFKKYQKTQNKLDPNIATTVDFSLEIGAVTETVEVTASATTIQSESATLGKIVTTKELETLQLNGQNPIFLALLKPGVRGNNSLTNFSFDLTAGDFNINGSRSRDNLITYDGAVGIRTPVRILPQLGVGRQFLGAQSQRPTRSMCFPPRSIRSASGYRILLTTT